MKSSTRMEMILIGLCFWFMFSISIQAKESFIARKSMDTSSQAAIEVNLLPAVNALCTTKQSSNSVLLNWEKVDSADYYIVSRREKNEISYHLIAKTEKTRAYDKEIENNHTYRYQVIPVAYQEDGSLIYGEVNKITFRNYQSVDVSDANYSYEEFKQDVQQIKDKYSAYCGVSTIGVTPDNRSLYRIEIGNRNASKHILVIGNLHAREYMTSLLCMKQIEYYLENYNKKIAGVRISKLLEDISILYIPMANPDGTTIVHNGIAGIEQRALRNQLLKIGGNDFFRIWKANANGVDLNRNFTIGFSKESARNPGFMNFSGKQALSEPESKAIATMIKNYHKKEQDIVAIINYHAAGEIIFGGVSSVSSSKIKKTTGMMFTCAQRITQYQNAAGFYKDTANGDFRSYHLRVLGIPGITLEIGKGTTPLPLSQFKKIWKDNSTLILEEIKCLTKEGGSGSNGV